MVRNELELAVKEPLLALGVLQAGAPVVVDLEDLTVQSPDLVIVTGGGAATTSFGVTGFDRSHSRARLQLCPRSHTLGHRGGRKWEP